MDKEYAEGKKKKKKKKKKETEKKKDDSVGRQDSVATTEGDLSGIKLTSMRGKPRDDDSDDEIASTEGKEKESNIRDDGAKDSDDEDDFLEDLLFGESEKA